MSVALIVSLILIGFLLIIIEIFLTPGFVVGLVGLAVIAVGLGMVYKEYGVAAGNYSVLASAAVLGIGIVWAFKGGVWTRFAIKDQIQGKANDVDKRNVNVGDQGEAISALRPSGTAMINGQKVEVHTDGEFLVSRDRVEVIKVVNNRIIVKLINQ